MSQKIRNIKELLSNLSLSTIFDKIGSLAVKIISIESLTTIISIEFTLIIFFELNPSYSVYNHLLQYLLTVNGIFSAILITYLFTRITWTKDRKLEYYKESIRISHKITDFRRVMYLLTKYYNVWIDEDRHTKKLLESSKYRHIDFHDFHLSLTSDYNPLNAELINELIKENTYSEGISSVYLAMVSMVNDRRSEKFHFNEEIYTDHQYQEIYDHSLVVRWLECGITDTIGYWFDRPNQFLNFTALRNDREAILDAAKRINSKFEGVELNNALVKDLAYEMSFQIKELYGKLNSLRQGFQKLDTLIITLITLSFSVGVLFPLTLLILSDGLQFFILERIAIAINLGLILFFILRLPMSIYKELNFFSNR